MSAHVGLLRAVNLGSRNRVAMSDLREMVEGLGFGEVRTLLQSGNVVFRGGRRSSPQLEQVLERGAREHLGFPIEFFVRTADDWRDVIANNPFPKEAARDPGHLLVMFLKQVPSRAQVEALQKRITGREVVRAHGRQAYFVYPDGVGRSKLTNAVIEPTIATRGTARNWNTVLKLAALAEA